MRTSVSQFQLMVEFMERNGDLSKPTDGPQGRMNNIQCWAQLTEMLNADSTGNTKTAEKWRKVWSDLKNNTKKKYARIHRDATGTGGGPASRIRLSDLEERVLNIVGFQAATGIPDIEEIGLYQEDIHPIPVLIPEHSEVPEATENTFATWSQTAISASDQPAQLPEGEIEPPPPVPSGSRSAQNIEIIERQMPNVQDTPPIPEAPQIPTPLPATPRRRRRLLHTVPSPTRRRTRTQTQSELARQAFVNSDSQWRVFQQKCEEERLRLREKEIHQQERWLDLFAQFIVLANRLVDICDK